MAIILNEEQSAQIKTIQAKQKEIDKTYGTFDGWMCEGADEKLLVFFNNDLDVCFYADNFGNIVANPYNVKIPKKLREIVKLEGQISQLIYRIRTTKV